MRIAIFAESYLPYLSGVTVSTDGLARGLAAAGNEVLLVVPRPSRMSEPPSVAVPRLRVAWLPSYQLPVLAPAGYRMPWPAPAAALAEVGRFRPDVVHAQSPFVAGLMAARAAGRARVPLVFTHHTRFNDYRHYLGPLAGATRLSDAYIARFWRRCAAVIAPSEALARDIQAQLRALRPRVHVVPTGVEVGMISGIAPVDPRELAGWPPTSVVVAGLGRLAKEKSVDLLVEAFAISAAREPRLRLVLVGDGPLGAAIAARARRPDLDGRVLLAGRLPRHDALALLRGCDLFAFASRTETQGLVLAEAIAAGLPVVALSGPGVDESVRDGFDGILVPDGGPSREPALLGAALASLAASDERRSAMRRNALEGAERFSIRRWIGRVEGVYTEARDAA
ncbi:MAG: hypothetical protein DLM71_09950 [Chloroflexi bacterium]|nr:MAG: hypothetical protein DLM71_09950 [Chloroflexota bacterium]